MTHLMSDEAAEKNSACTEHLVEHVSEWIKMLPSSLNLRPRAGNDFLSLFFNHEFKAAENLIELLVSDLNAVIGSIHRTILTDNYTRMLIESLKKAQIPTHWIKKLKFFNRNSSPIQFVRDICKRVTQCIECSKYDNLQKFPVWIGGLFDIDGFLTATQQTASQNLGISLEKLSVYCTFSEPCPKAVGFNIKDLNLFGAFIDSRFKLSDKTGSISVKNVHLLWKEKIIEDGPEIKIPVFANESRERILFYFAIPKNKLDNSEEEIIKRGVGFTA